MRIKINTKLSLFILISSAIIFSISIGYLNYSLKAKAKKDTKTLVDSYAKQYANEIRSKFNIDVGLSRGIAYALTDNWNLDYKKKFDLYENILSNNLMLTDGYSGVWASMELNAYGENYTKSYGRARLSAFISNGEYGYRIDSVNMAGDSIGSQYHDIKLSKMETVDEPYMFSISGREGEEILITSMCVPILKNNVFRGIAGVDFDLQRSQKIIDSIQIFEGQNDAYLIAYNGKYVAHPNKKMYNQSYSDEFPEFDEKYNVLQNIKNGNSFSFIGTINNIETYYSFSPIQIGKTVTPWSICMAVPVNVIMKKANIVFQRSIIIGIIGLIILSIIIWILSRSVSNPIVHATEILKKIDKGIIDVNDKIKVKVNDEIGIMSRSVNNLVGGINRIAVFARQVGQGNLESEYKLLSKRDELGNALLGMRNSLKSAKEEEEKRKREEKEVNWVTEGLAKFGDILRYNSDNMEEFGYSIIHNLVSYMECIQGGIFLINDDDPQDKFIELVALHGYGRRKFADMRIEFNEGLIGQCIHEQETIYLSEVPDSYVTITSGVGEKNPGFLLLVPLKFNEQIYGAIEIASFTDLNFYQIDFSEKIAKNIASSISTIQTNIRTAKLFEESKEKSEKMAMQEEEIRQNIEEMQATQEEMSRTIEDLKRKEEKISLKIKEKEKEIDNLKKNK